MVEIREVKPTRPNLKKFTDFQIKLYKDNPYYVPPLVMDDCDTLTPSKNPAFDFCDAQCFMAYRDGKPVGRVAGIINHQVNEKEGKKNVRFGFLDFIDDAEVTKALMDAVEDWGRKKGMKRIVGPLGFTDLDREGVLIEGFDELSTMATNYNYPYYSPRLEELGYKKESDWMEFQMTVPDGIPERYNRIADIVKKKFGLKVVKFKSGKEAKAQYGEALFHLVNEAYKDLYEYSPLTDRQIQHYIKVYLNILDFDLVPFIVDEKGELVGIGISMPSLSKALQKSKGKLFPFGWIHLLKALKGKNDRVDLLLVAVKPEYQSKGVNALLFQDLIPHYIRKGFKLAESNPEMESNDKVQNQWSSFETRQHRRRRSYMKEL